MATPIQQLDRFKAAWEAHLEVARALPRLATDVSGAIDKIYSSLANCGPLLAAGIKQTLRVLHNSHCAGKIQENAQNSLVFPGYPPCGWRNELEFLPLSRDEKLPLIGKSGSALNDSGRVDIRRAY